MKIKLNALLKFAYLEGLTEKNSPFIANQYVRWTYKAENNTLTWTISTSSYQISVINPATDIDEVHATSFDIGLNAVKLFATIKALRGDVVTLTIDEGSAKLKCGRTNVLIPLIVGGELPDPLVFNRDAWSTTPSHTIGIFKDIAKLPTFTTADNTVFSGVMVGFKDTGFELYASNRGTIYHIVNPISDSVAGETSALPKTFVTAISKLNISDEAKIKVGKLSDSGLYVVAWTDGDNKGFISSRKLEFPIPDITRALGGEWGHEFKLSKSEFIDSIKLHEAITELNTITFELSKEALKIEHTLLDRQILLDQDIPDGPAYEPFKITLGVRDIINILNTIDGDKATFWTSATNNMVVFKDNNKTVIQAKMRRF